MPMRRTLAAGAVLACWSGVGAPAVTAASKAEVAALEERCLSGKPKDCERLASLYRDGKGVDVDLERAVLYYSFGQGKPEARSALARAAAALETSCRSGVSDDCESAAFLLAKGLAGRRDVAQAAQLLGQAAEPEARSRSDLARAIVVFAHACAGGETQEEAVACRQWGAAAEGATLSQQISQDVARAGAALDAACQAGSAWDCNTVGFMYMQGALGPKDLPRGVELFRKACDAGLRGACVNLRDYGPAAAAAAAPAVPGSAEEHEQGCQAGTLRSCFLLGRIYETGQGVERDLVRAIRLYKRVCDGGAPPGCGAILAIYERDPSTGEQLFQQACAEANDCDAYQAMLVGYKAVKRLEGR